MSDSSRRASVELPLESWHQITQALSALSIDGVRLEIENQLPPAMPTGLGAVIEAAHEKYGDPEIWVLCAADTECRYGWRLCRHDADRRTIWAHAGELEPIRVMSEGIPWPA